MRTELYSKLGIDDTPSDKVLANPDSVHFVNFIDSNGDLKHGVGQILNGLFDRALQPSELAVDLLVVAASAYAADTRFVRQQITEDGWTRQMTLYIPVSEPKIWSQASAHLSRMLKFLTGDFWTFCFRHRPGKFKSLARIPEDLDLSNFDCVSLFSGGLDSLIGAIDLINDGQKPLLISHYWDGETSSAQLALLESLKNHFGNECYDSIRARIGFDSAALLTNGVEPTQRARSFLFYSMAAVTADALPNTNAVVIPENGLIALNVPLEPLRLGALSTRTAHPFFIECMGELTSQLGLHTTFDNPYRFRTKGEMVAKCLDPKLLEKITPNSMSCSSPAKVRWKGATPQHCGHCVPCIIRRAALQAGLLGDDLTEYYLDELRDRILDSKMAEGRDIRSLLFAARAANKKPNHNRYLVRKPGPLPPVDIETYADVYERGMKEVAVFLKGVRVKH